MAHAERLILDCARHLFGAPAAPKTLAGFVELPTHRAASSLIILHALTSPVFAQNTDEGAEDLIAAEAAAEAAIAADSASGLDDVAPAAVRDDIVRQADATPEEESP